MVEIKIIYDQDTIAGFKAQGHAGHSPAGTDIYCAGVSAITQTALIGLMKHLSRPPVYKVKEGWLDCRLPGSLNREDIEKAQLILSTMEAGLLSLQENYPQYIKVLTGRF